MLAGFLVFVIDGFKSYHYGIEIEDTTDTPRTHHGFKSYHYGIEIKYSELSEEERAAGLNRTIMELK